MNEEIKYLTKVFYEINEYPVTIMSKIAQQELNHCLKSVQIWSFSDLYFPVFGLNTGKYWPEITPYSDTFHAVNDSQSNSHRTSDTNKTPNKVQLILPYSGKQEIKLIAKMKKYIRKTLAENIQTIVTIRATNCLQSFM